MENVNVDEFVRNGGRIFRRREEAPGLPEVEMRTITVAYRRVNGNIEYGASIHRKEGPSQLFARKPHNTTAVHRLTHNPVVIPDQDFGHPNERESYIRECLRTHGCADRTEPEEDSE
jgi:hypothetical protein